MLMSQPLEIEFKIHGHLHTPHSHSHIFTPRLNESFIGKIFDATIDGVAGKDNGKGSIVIVAFI